MVNPTADQVFILKADEVASKIVGSELIVLELASSTYLTLNGTARDLWEALTEGASVSSLVEMLMSRYKVLEDLARSDAESFVAALMERGLLQAAS